MKTTSTTSSKLAYAITPTNHRLMKISFTLIAACFVLLFVFAGCGQKTAPIDVESLPELPQELADTLDPNTMATKTLASTSVPAKPPNVAFAPCCSSTKTRTLQVTYSYAKCVPLRIAFSGPFPQLVLANPGGNPTPSGGAPTPSPGQPSVKTFKLTSFKQKALNEKLFCTTSPGPWNATFIEERKCSPVTPQDTLIINAFSDQVIIQWAGGTPNHPSNVQVVSCRDIGETQTNCGVSSCDCRDSSCPETQPCTCTLQDWFP